MFPRNSNERIARVSTGQIPPQLGGLRAVKSLKLSDNKLEGESSMQLSLTFTGMIHA